MTRKDYVKLVKWIAQNDIGWSAVDGLITILADDNHRFCRQTFVDHIQYNKKLQIEERRKDMLS